MMVYAPGALDDRTDDEIVAWVFNTAIFFGCGLTTAAIVAQHFIDGIRAERRKAEDE